MTTYESLQWKRLLAKPHDHWVVLSDLGQKTRTAKSESYFKFTLSNTPQAGGYYLANASQLSLNFHFSSQRTNLIGPCHPNCHWRIYCARQDCRPGGTLVSGPSILREKMVLIPLEKVLKDGPWTRHIPELYLIKFTTLTPAVIDDIVACLSLGNRWQCLVYQHWRRCISIVGFTRAEFPSKKISWPRSRSEKKPRTSHSRRQNAARRVWIGSSNRGIGLGFDLVSSQDVLSTKWCCHCAWRHVVFSQSRNRPWARASILAIL